MNRITPNLASMAMPIRRAASCDWAAGAEMAMPLESAATTGGEQGEGEGRFPTWLAAFLVVAYCGVFWTGVVTIIRWMTV